MTIFINNKSTKFCKTTLRIKMFIHKRKGYLFLRHGADDATATAAAAAAAVCSAQRTHDHLPFLLSYIYIEFSLLKCFPVYVFLFFVQCSRQRQNNSAFERTVELVIVFSSLYRKNNRR